jgi:hypothetical protein
MHDAASFKECPSPTVEVVEGVYSPFALSEWKMDRSSRSAGKRVNDILMLADSIESRSRMYHLVVPLSVGKAEDVGWLKLMGLLTFDVFQLLWRGLEKTPISLAASFRVG